MHRTRAGGLPLRVVVAAAFVAAALVACERRAPRDNDSAAPAAVAEPVADAADLAPAPERPVDAESLPYAEVGEELVYGYFAAPSDMVEPLPALLLVHDWWGLEDNTRGAADRLAAAGYMVLAVDLYGGETATDASAAREKAIALMENTPAVESNLQQAVQFVDAVGAPTVGIVGWGIGGGFALDAAVKNPERISAVVLFYSQVPANTDHLATLKARVLGFYGSDDQTVKADAVEAFVAATNRLGNPADIEIYTGAGHGFADDRRRHYDADLAAKAWQRMLDFLAAQLAAPGRP